MKAHYERVTSAQEWQSTNKQESLKHFSLLHLTSRIIQAVDAIAISASSIHIFIFLK